MILPVRISIGWDDTESLSNENNQQSHLCVVGYGQVAEFPSLPESSLASMETEQESIVTVFEQLSILQKSLWLPITTIYCPLHPILMNTNHSIIYNIVVPPP
jgi:hypothetical protein